MIRKYYLDFSNCKEIHGEISRAGLHELQEYSGVNS
jgi:hypothetical protein